MIPRFARWYEEHPVAGDTGLALALLPAFVVPSELAESSERATGLALSAALGSATGCWRSSAISRPRSSAPGSRVSCTTSSRTRCR